jgi:hypothetical protein
VAFVTTNEPPTHRTSVTTSIVWQLLQPPDADPLEVTDVAEDRADDGADDVPDDGADDVAEEPDPEDTDPDEPDDDDDELDDEDEEPDDPDKDEDGNEDEDEDDEDELDDDEHGIPHPWQLSVTNSAVPSPVTPYRTAI